MQAFELEKNVWTDDDFSVLGFHDCKIWGFLAESEKYEFLFDLDYIFNWVKPQSPYIHYQFWISPVTLVFENACNISIKLESRDGHFDISELYRENSRPTKNRKLIEHDYRFLCHEGEIIITATGFKMFVREAPILLDSQFIDLEARKGIRFDRELIAS